MRPIYTIYRVTSYLRLLAQSIDINVQPEYELDSFRTIPEAWENFSLDLGALSPATIKKTASECLFIAIHFS